MDNFTDEELQNEMDKRDLKTDLSDYWDGEIEAEYEKRGLSDLSDYSDEAIEEEYFNRGYGDFVDSCTKTVNNINQDKPVTSDIRNILEKFTGKLITKPIK